MHIAYQMDITIPGNGMFSENLDFLIFFQQGYLLGIVVMYGFMNISISVPINTIDLERLNFRRLSCCNPVMCWLKHPRDKVVMRKNVFVCAQNIF